MSRSKELILLAQRIRALSQTGLVYSLSEYDTERYEELSRLSDEITALATGLKPDDVASGYRPAQEYVTPKVDIRAVVFNEKDEILLVCEKMDGCWSLPGGWSDVGYSPKEVAAKEVKEETGLDVLPVRLLAVMDMSKHPHPAIPYYVYKFFILCELKGGSFTETFDILGKGFFRLEELPPLSLERVLPEQIQRTKMFIWIKDTFVPSRLHFKNNVMKRYCQTLDLKEDEQLIKEYCYWHSPEHIWPEIPEGIRAVGILNMEIYRLGTRLLMIVETPDDFDWDAAFARLATMDKQAEWEDFVARYQKAAPGSSSSEKWQLMECMFKLPGASK